MVAAKRAGLDARIIPQYLGEMIEPTFIRPALPADFSAWLPLWEGYNGFYHRTIPETVTRTTWGRFFDGYEPVHALVAKRDGALIGLVHYLYHRNTAMLGYTCYLQDLFTSEAARGGGGGRALIEAVYARAKSDGAERVYWMTQESNTVARVCMTRWRRRPGLFSTGRGFRRLQPQCFISKVICLPFLAPASPRHVQRFEGFAWSMTDNRLACPIQAYFPSDRKQADRHPRTGSWGKI